MSLPERVRALRLPAASVLSCATICSCGEKRHFSVKSEDGSCVMYGVEKVLHHHRNDSWIFCDSDADSLALELRFSVGSQDLKVPRQITHRIANPTQASFSVERPSASVVDIHASGSNCSGINRLHLEYKDGQLVRARTYAVDELEPEILFP